MSGCLVQKSLKTSVWGLSKDIITCCCRYHVEARSLFLKSMEFRKKYTIPCISEDDNDIYHVYEHLTDITVATLCDKDPAQNCFLASCLDRECCKCGVYVF
jgi:hypothetical protein